MYILSQDKTRIYNMSGHIEGIGYEESKEIPTQEEMEKQKDLIKQLAEAGQEVAAGIEDLLKEMFNGE